MKKYTLIALAGIFAVGTVTATAINADKGKKKKHGCCTKMEQTQCKKEMKKCARM